MANNNNYFNQPMPQYQAQQFFPQPQGNVFLINNTLEVANVPVSSGLSIALCMSEGIMYLKSLQNGNPVLMAYNLTPYNVPQSQTQDRSEKTENYEDRIKNLEKQMENIIKKLNNAGGKISEQLI